MNCKQQSDNLEDLVDGRLDDGVAATLREHAKACEGCRQAIAEAGRLGERLREYGRTDVPVPDSAFFDQALVRAQVRGARQLRNRWWLKGFGSAVAAGFALWVMAGVFFEAPGTTGAGTGIPGVTMALAEPRTVNLVFSSATELDDATLTVALPPGIEIAGFEGRREITWVTSLRQGRNILPLRLVATTPQGGELLATLQHDDDDRTFRLRVTVI
jgi:anti-sigma factor RsiW